MSAATQSSSGNHSEPAWVGQVLHCWFEEVSEQQWFEPTHGLDARIHARFLALHEHIASGQVTPVMTARSLLAAVIVLDQFSRNMFRGTPRAYAADLLARKYAETALAHKYDVGMSVHERQFLYMPFQHSEDRQDQARSVGLFAKLGDENLSRYALAHQSIIDRFGRFPHRNAILNRDSSASELESLNEPMSSF